MVEAAAYHGWRIRSSRNCILAAPVDDLGLIEIFDRISEGVFGTAGDGFRLTASRPY